ncbi:MAG: DUF5103 domain-containing protein [Prevotella sp.]|nr:DUF5103 domain-containing protein [Prevotella sp.]
MKRLLLFLVAALPITALGHHKILAPDFKSLQVIVNDNWLAPLPIMELGTNDVVNISFDQLSHNYHRLVYHLELCNPDWTPNDALFESDWLEGFNDRPIDDYENSLNTNVLYTHYHMTLPNNDTRLKMSGNYRLHIIDEDNDGEEVIVVELRVLEPLTQVGLSVTTNTDLGLNGRYQQVNMTLGLGALRVTDPNNQLQTFVLQNGREDNMKENVRPNYITPQQLTWEHNRRLIFDAGNEYHKFELLDPNYPTLGLDRVRWDEQERRYHAFPLLVEQRRNYVYDEDADGAFIIRNSDNIEIDNTSEYVYVHYKVKAVRRYDNARVILDGRWTMEPADTYELEYNAEDNTYNAVVMQKLGYYNYQLLLKDYDGTTHPMPEEGSFFQTENKYEALVYYRGTGERSWRLVGFHEMKFKAL